MSATLYTGNSKYTIVKFLMATLELNSGKVNVISPIVRVGVMFLEFDKVHLFWVLFY